MLSRDLDHPFVETTRSRRHAAELSRDYYISPRGGGGRDPEIIALCNGPVGSA